MSNPVPNPTAPSEGAPLHEGGPVEGGSLREGAPADGGGSREGAPSREGGSAQERGSSRERTCIGCGERGAPEEMVRLVLGPDGEVAVDAAGGGFGRGAHVHARKACITQAATRGLLRASKGRAESVSVAVKEGGEIATTEAERLSAIALAEAIEAAMARRIAGLFATAVRTRNTRVGADAVTAAWRTGDAALIVVATDAAAGRDLGAVREAVSEGAAVSWGTKATLATALFRGKNSSEGVAVVAITDTRIADAVRDAVEKAMGAWDARQSAPRDVRQSVPRDAQKPVSRDVRQSAPRAADEAAATRRGVKVAAPRAGNRSKVNDRRAGRASGRRARVTKAVAERGE